MIIIYNNKIAVVRKGKNKYFLTESNLVTYFIKIFEIHRNKIISTYDERNKLGWLYTKSKDIAILYFLHSLYKH